jgi:signal transduction histidine kinase
VRRRLLLVLLVSSALVVTALAWPLLISTAAARTNQLENSRTHDLDWLAAIAQQAFLDGDYTDLVADVRDYHELFGYGVVVHSDQAPIVQEGLSPTDPDVAAAIALALKNQSVTSLSDLRPWSSDSVLLARPIGNGSQVTGAVVLRLPVRDATADITTKWLMILLIALAATVSCGLLALWLARWVLRPLPELERGVLAVTAGQRYARIDERHGPPELRVLANSFNRMSEAIAESAAQQRRLVADASHELRSPIARLRLPVDSLAEHVKNGGHEAYGRIVAEVEELESLSSSLLELANADRIATELAAGAGAGAGANDSCDAMELLVERREAWLPAAGHAGIRLDGPDSTLSVRLGCPEIELKQILDVGIDNAIRYAGAGSQVRLECTAVSGHGRVAIVDNGRGLTPQELPKATTRFWRSRRHHTETGSGLGLAIAERLVTARGGTLAVRANSPSGLVVECILPLAEEVT